jgi:hypothetical protein
VCIGNVDGSVLGDHPVRTEVQALPGDNLERDWVDPHEPAGVVGDPDRSGAEGDALRTAEHEWFPDDTIRRRIDRRDRRPLLVPLVIVADPDETSAENGLAALSGGRMLELMNVAMSRSTLSSG